MVWVNNYYETLFRFVTTTRAFLSSIKNCFAICQTEDNNQYISGSFDKGRRRKISTKLRKDAESRLISVGNQ